MITHAPKEYRCPFCAVVQGVEGDFRYSKQADIVHLDEDVLIMISSHWWPGCEGNALIIPVRHVENIYELSEEDMRMIAVWSQRVAMAMKTSYKCDGISLRQHNEPAGNQDVWRYHQHVFPRYYDDQLYSLGGQSYLSDPIQRIEMADRLRDSLRCIDKKTNMN
jgi:histidine triad (HIT) family protein